MKESTVEENLLMLKKKGRISRASEATGLKKTKDSSILKGGWTEHMGTVAHRQAEMVVEILKGLF